MKYVLITGTSSGLGRETAKLFLDSGAFVFGVDINEGAIENKNYLHIKCDLTKEDSPDLIFGEIKKRTSRLDGVFNIAGIFMFESIVEGSVENLYKIIEVNFFSVYKLNKKILPLLDCNSKIIVFTSELARYSPQPFNGYYPLSKIILDKYADILRRELNYLKIKVIKVQTGAIKTGLLDGVNDKYKKVLEKSVYYKKPLVKLKKLMDDEIKKQTSPEYFAKKLFKIFNKKNNKICYRFKNSFKLRFLSIIPEKLQDKIYLSVIK